jgi:hypothetical protein
LAHACLSAFWLLKLHIRSRGYEERQIFLSQMGFTSADLPLLKAPFFFHTVANRLPRWLEVVFTAWPAGWNWRSRDCGAYTFLCQPGWGVPRNLNWGTGPGWSLYQPSRAVSLAWTCSVEGADIVNRSRSRSRSQPQSRFRH